MIKIAAKTLIDLEFPTICQQISEFCITQMGVEKALAIVPYKTSKKTVFGLTKPMNTLILTSRTAGFQTMVLTAFTRRSKCWA
jgi:dsDNA-specific endonuclease/ATPase MutS2